MHLTATLLNYFHLCHRKMWLHAHAIRMEHTSDIVYEGKLIGETTYPQRAERYTEVEISVEPVIAEWEWTNDGNLFLVTTIFFLFLP